VPPVAPPKLDPALVPNPVVCAEEVPATELPPAQPLSPLPRLDPAFVPNPDVCARNGDICAEGLPPDEPPRPPFGPAARVSADCPMFHPRSLSRISSHTSIGSRGAPLPSEPTVAQQHRHDASMRHRPKLAVPLHRPRSRHASTGRSQHRPYGGRPGTVKGGSIQLKWGRGATSAVAASKALQPDAPQSTNDVAPRPITAVTRPTNPRALGPQCTPPRDSQ